MAIRWLVDGWTFRGRQRRFEQSIQEEYSWLFEKYDARIVPLQRYRQVLDYQSARISIGDLLFKFSTGMGEIHVSVTPAHAPYDVDDFGETIDLACNSGQKSNARNYRVSNFQKLFEANIERLKVYFSKEVYGQPRAYR